MRLMAAATVIVMSASLLGASATGVAARDGHRDRQPTAGAPWYIGRLCHFHTDWRHVPDGPQIIDNPGLGLISIKADFDAETHADIRVDDAGTPTDKWDDHIHITMTVYADGPDVVIEHPPLPLYEPGGGGGVGGGFTTENTPEDLAYTKIEFLGSTEVRSAVTHRAAIPMFAKGWFADLPEGQQGFSGSDAPECVRGSNDDDEIRTRGGSDRISGQYGEDFLHGGAGDDDIDGGADDDHLQGGSGADHLQSGSGNDCYNGGQDGRRDWLDDKNGLVELNTFIAEPGVLDGVQVATIEHMTDEDAFLSTVCP